ncbi:glycosyl hydrolase 115 family protein [Stakelama marina]|uniref:Glycosyl hydrolase 115 family protein n=1 Tax=Stakelama marina TaxID=2826939 RepID=A0A8T4ID09_9SPHN|nr:glycosyl hydrolase 115 family protein [Stakelama marina]MBR0552281.1 glycosyl hydrolase 115 family protein [Stakelama marina]
MGRSWLWRPVAAALLLLAPVVARACDTPVSACEDESTGALQLVGGDAPVTVMVSAGEDRGVLHAVSDLRGDIASVGGAQPVSATYLPNKAASAVMVGTIGRSAWLDRLARSGKLDLSGLKGQWEGYVEQVVDSPAPGIDRALVIAGSDRRGTIYGVYDISAKIGVSPWNWWADVPPRHHDALWLTPGRVADHPTVKYRGIFLNDEEPALGTWVRSHFGGFNHKFYQKLYPLILRLKGNFLWPAMWGKSLWDDDPLSAPLANEYGVVLGTSHHEPMGRSQIEWARYGSGPWDYTTNARRLNEFWRKGMERRDGNETLVTVGMRGDGDKPMTQGTATKLLERIVGDQRAIIADTTGKPAADTPQVWALYKEVQDYYDQGMRVPDDVTLLFSDDNWGNIRRLPEPGKTRPGGYGVYYHFDYVGGPRNYKWIDTNAITRVWQQMEMAHAYGADRLWIVNVGDLKPMEYPISFFLDMAWNPDAMTPGAMERYPDRWAAQQFGPDHAQQIGALIARYGALASRRKPELIDASTYGLSEWASVVKDWNDLEARARKAEAALPADMHDAYYELVLHRIAAMANLHRLYYAVARNHRAARDGDAAAAKRYAEEARKAFAEDKAIRHVYEDRIADGKWTGMMAQTHIGYTSWNDPSQDIMPDLWTPEDSKAAANPKSGSDVVASFLPVSGDMRSGHGFTWRTIPKFDWEGAAVIASPVTGNAIEHPGGDTPSISHDFSVDSAGPVTVRVRTAPGLDVRGRGEHRYAVSIDGGAPRIVNLLDGEDEASWGRAVADNARFAETRFDLARAGKHMVHIWLVDPQVVFEKVSIRR